MNTGQTDVAFHLHDAQNVIDEHTWLTDHPGDLVITTDVFVHDYEADAPEGFGI